MRGPRPPLTAYGPLLVAGVAQVPWRSSDLYAGGADPVVLAKAALTIVAVAWAVGVAALAPRRPVPAAPSLWLAAYLSCALVGAVAAGNPMPSIVLTVRILLLAVLVVALLSVHPPLDVLHATLAALGTIAVVGLVTGLAAWNGGRLRGGVPPLHPNELGALAAYGCIWWSARIFGGIDSFRTVLAALGAAAVVVLSGSRTAFLGLGLAIVILVVTATGMRARTAAALALVPGVGVLLLTETSLFEEAVTRGGSTENVLTLANRTIAWEAALQPSGSAWHDWFGGGLAQRTVAVAGQWWTEQVLDSSWVSALVQAGYLGFLVAAAWALSVLVGAARSERSARGLRLALTAFVLLRGGLENGLFDSSTMFLVFFVLAHGCEIRAVRQKTPTRASPAGIPMTAAT